jgi:hypothetical protein
MIKEVMDDMILFPRRPRISLVAASDNGIMSPITHTDDAWKL